MEKINVAELLKDCPQGMELDCTMYDKFILVGVDNDLLYPIKVMRKDGCLFTLTKYGQYCNSDYAKCIIFPKGKTTWEGFQRPFKDGDVVTSVFQGVVQGTGIFDYEEQSEAWIHVCINLNNEFFTDGYLGHVYDLRLATEEEKQKLFQAIKDNGYKWNEETKTLEKLVEPIFKVGDRIKHKCEKFRDERTIISYGESGYWTSINDWIDYKNQDDWELVPNKFDFTTLKPFDKVLVRDFDNTSWEIEFFSRLLDGKHFKCFDLSYVQCIHYEGNEHLLGKTDDCDEYFKTWK